MEFCSKYGYNYGFHGSDSEELLDEEINSNGKTKKNFRKADSNIIAFKFDKLDKPNGFSFAKPYICKECSAIMSLLSKVEKEDNQIEWKCEFCEAINNFNFESNIFVDFGERSQDDITYFLNEIEKVRNNANTYFIFCIDVSGSMDSILEEVKQACIKNLEKLESEQPNTKVGLVTFSQQVKFYGDCSSDTPYICNELNDKDELFKLAQDYNSELMNVSRSKNNILNRIKQIRTEGQTALGPGLVFSIGFSGKISGSEVILCTDGIANVGMGTNDTNFYDKLAEDAKQRGVRVNVITIDGCETNLSILGKIADKSNGLVNIVEPENIAKNFTSIIDNKIVATNVKVKLVLNKKMMYVRDEELEIAETAALTENDINKKSVCEKDIGNANTDSEIFFEYGIRKLNNNQAINTMPFQLQISYKSKSGCNAIRVYSKIQQFNSDRKVVEKNINNKNIILSNATQKIANYILTSNHVLAENKSKQIKNYKELNMMMPSELIQMTEHIEKSTRKNELNNIDDNLAKKIYNCKKMTSEKLTKKSDAVPTPKKVPTPKSCKAYIAYISDEELSEVEKSDDEYLSTSSDYKSVSVQALSSAKKASSSVSEGIKKENGNQQGQKGFKLSDNLSIDLSSSKVADINSFKNYDGSSSLIGIISDTDVYESLEICEEAIELPGIKIIRYEDSLSSSNADNFSYQIKKLSTVNPTFIYGEVRNIYKEEFKKLMRFYTKQKTVNWRSDISSDDMKTYIIDKEGMILLKDNQQNLRNHCKYQIISKIKIEHVILDCSSMIYVDPQGVEIIRNLCLDYKEVGVGMYLSHCRENLKKTFDKYSLHDALDIKQVFDSTHEAVSAIFEKNDKDFDSKHQEKFLFVPSKTNKKYEGEGEGEGEGYKTNKNYEGEGEGEGEGPRFILFSQEKNNN